MFGSKDDSHPAVNYLLNIAGSHYVGGKLRGVEPPTYYDFKTAARHPCRVA